MTWVLPIDGKAPRPTNLEAEAPLERAQTPFTGRASTNKPQSAQCPTPPRSRGGHRPTNLEAEAPLERAQTPFTGRPPTNKAGSRGAA